MHEDFILQVQLECSISMLRVYYTNAFGHNTYKKGVCQKVIMMPRDWY